MSKMSLKKYIQRQTARKSIKFLILISLTILLININTPVLNQNNGDQGSYETLKDNQILSPSTSSEVVMEKVELSINENKRSIYVSGFGIENEGNIEFDISVNTNKGIYTISNFISTINDETTLQTQSSGGSDVDSEIRPDFTINTKSVDVTVETKDPVDIVVNSHTQYFEFTYGSSGHTVWDKSYSSWATNSPTNWYLVYEEDRGVELAKLPDYDEFLSYTYAKFYNIDFPWDDGIATYTDVQINILGRDDGFTHASFEFDAWGQYNSLLDASISINTAYHTYYF